MWITQDYDGYLKLHTNEPHIICDIWVSKGSELNGKHSPNKNWRDSLINLETHDYKIKDGILVKVSKHMAEMRHGDLKRKPTPRKHAELACKYFLDDTVEIQSRVSKHIDWENNNNPCFLAHVEYREKPKTKTVRFRNYINHDNEAWTWHAECTPPDLKEWVGDCWQEVEVSCDD